MHTLRKVSLTTGFMIAQKLPRRALATKAGAKWEDLAQDRNIWDQLEDGFAQASQ